MLKWQSTVGFLFPEKAICIEELIKEHVDEKRDWSGYLWNIIIFERWLNKKTI